MAETTRTEPEWLSLDIALAIHDRQLSEHGGPSGVRDSGALESALARPQNKWEYGEDDLSALAAAYAFGLARNHPFVDGNKRTAAVVSETFLMLNGYSLDASDAEVAVAFVVLAAGELPKPNSPTGFASAGLSRQSPAAR